MARRAKGSGSISQRADGRWIGQVTIDSCELGSCRQIRKSVSGQSQKEVVEKIKQLQSLQIKDELVKTDKLTVEKWLYQWIDNYKKNNIKQTTYDSYLNTIKIHIVPLLGKTQLQKLTTNIVQKFINDLISKGTSARTIHYSVYVLSSALKQAIKNKTLSNNVCNAVELPKLVLHPITTLTLEQMQQFEKSMEEYRVPNTKLKTRHHPLYPAFLLQMTTGIRRGELLGITYENLHLDEGYVFINQHLVVTSKGINLETPKTPNSIRELPLTPKVIELLRKHKGKKTKGFVFTTESGKPVHPRSYQRTFDMLLKKAGLPKIRIHDLRHGFATTMLGNGVDLATTSLMLGHSDPKFTAKVYVHPTMAMKKKAMDKMADMMNSLKEKVVEPI